MNISVSIATCNRAELLRAALQALLAQDYSAADFDVIVADNGSKDHTREVADAYARRFRHFTYIHDSRPGQLVGWHRALAAARGEIACFIDDDVQPSTDWLSSIAEAYDDPSVGMATGPIEPVFEAGPPEWLDAMVLGDRGERIMPLLGMLDFGAVRRDIPGNYVWGSNFSIRRQLLLDVGGFHPGAMPGPLLHFYGDAEVHVGRDVEARGHRIQYHPDAKVTHEIPASRLSPEALRARFLTSAYGTSYQILREHRAAYDPPSRAAAQNLASRHFRDPATAPAEFREVATEAFFEGLTRHRAAFETDPAFREWVLMEDYLDLDRCYVHPDLAGYSVADAPDWRSGE